MNTTLDTAMMRRAIELARHGLYTTSPNPRVGCVLVNRDGVIVGEGWHEKAGESHAEVRALAAAGTAALASTAYVTLEPCSHFGRTPPCADALLKAGVRRVVAAMQDPNPLVAGQGLSFLRAQGIAVECGLCGDEARALNLGFISRMERQRPWVRLKTAASLDARTALANGESQWITGPEARRDGMRFRAQACAVLTGIGTVLADDPYMNVRENFAVFGEGCDEDTPIRQPLRVILDRQWRTPVGAHILREGPALIAGLAPNNPDSFERLKRLQNLAKQTQHNIETVQLPCDQPLITLLKNLAQRQINEVHLEAGPTLNGAFLAAGLVDELLLYLAPCLLGGDAKALFHLPAISHLTDKITLDIHDMTPIGKDWRCRATLKPPSEPALIRPLLTTPLVDGSHER